MEHETIDIADELNTPSQEHDVIGEGAPENELMKFVPITALLEMAASRLGVLICGWAAMVLVQGGMVLMLQTEDCVVVTMIFVVICSHYWPYICPQATGSLTEASQSLSANKLHIANDMQQLAIPIRFINRLFYWCKLVSAIICAVLSMMRLVSQNFGQTNVANMANRNFVLNFFYGAVVIYTLLLYIGVIIMTTMGMAMPRALTEALIELAKKVKSNLSGLSMARSNRNGRRRRCCKSKKKLQKLYCGLTLSFSSEVMYQYFDPVRFYM